MFANSKKKLNAHHDPSHLCALPTEPQSSLSWEYHGGEDGAERTGPEDGNQIMGGGGGEDQRAPSVLGPHQPVPGGWTAGLRKEEAGDLGFVLPLD